MCLGNLLSKAARTSASVWPTRSLAAANPRRSGTVSRSQTMTAPFTDRSTWHEAMPPARCQPRYGMDRYERMSKTRRVPQRARAIRRLAKLRETFGPDAAAERERLLRACGRARCRSGKELSSLHETLCFARAYPDNQAVLDLVQDLLDRW